jgi:hypothetical protein
MSIFSINILTTGYHDYYDASWFKLFLSHDHQKVSALFFQVGSATRAALGGSITVPQFLQVRRRMSE